MIGRFCLNVGLTWMVLSAAQAQEWKPVTVDLLKLEKTGFGGLCGVVVHPPTGHLIINLSDRGFFKSTDLGLTWNRLGNEDFKGRTETPLCLMIDPVKHDRFASALVYGSPLIVSASLDAPWKVLASTSTHVDWCALNWNKSEPDLILTLKHESGDLLLVSRDAGKTFEEAGKGYGPAWVFDSQTAVVAEAKSKSNTAPGLLRTTDAGRSFVRCANEHARALPRFKNGTLFWLTSTGLISSTDQGQSFTRLSDIKEGLCGPVFGQDSSHLLVLTSSGIIESSDGGRNWRAPIRLPSELKGTNHLSWTEFDPVHDIVYVMKMGSELYQFRRRP